MQQRWILIDVGQWYSSGVVLFSLLQGWCFQVLLFVIIDIFCGIDMGFGHLSMDRDAMLIFMSPSVDDNYAQFQFSTQVAIVDVQKFMVCQSMDW